MAHYKEKRKILPQTSQTKNTYSTLMIIFQVGLGYLVFKQTCVSTATMIAVTFITQSNVLLACIPTSKSFLNDTGISIELSFSHFLQQKQLLATTKLQKYIQKYNIYKTAHIKYQTYKYKLLTSLAERFHLSFLFQSGTLTASVSCCHWRTPHCS